MVFKSGVTWDTIKTTTFPLASWGKGSLVEKFNTNNNLVTKKTLVEWLTKCGVFEEKEVDDDDEDAAGTPQPPNKKVAIALFLEYLNNELNQKDSENTTVQRPVDPDWIYEIVMERLLQQYETCYWLAH